MDFNFDTSFEFQKTYFAKNVLLLEWFRMKKKMNKPILFLQGKHWKRITKIDEIVWLIMNLYFDKFRCQKSWDNNIYHSRINYLMYQLGYYPTTWSKWIKCSNAIGSMIDNC